MANGTVGSSEVGVKLAMSVKQERKATCFSAPVFYTIPMRGTTLAVAKGMGAGLWLSCSGTSRGTCASGLCFPH